MKKNVAAFLACFTLATSLFAGVKGVSTVQGVAGGTPVPVSDSAADSTSSGTLNAACTDASINSCSAGSAVSIATAGQFGAAVDIPSTSTLVASIKADCSSDGGTTWRPSFFTDNAVGKVATWTLASGVAFHSSIARCGGQSTSRVRLVSFTSGTSGTNATTLRASLANDSTTYQSPTYTCTFRLAARPYAISKVHTAGSRFQYATLYHASTALKTVRLKRVLFAMESNSVASIDVVDLMRLTTTAPATGNPAITPGKHNTNDPAAESTCLTLPTTNGSESDVLASIEYNLGITGSASVVNPAPPLTYQEVYSEDELGQVGDVKPLFMRAGVAEGFGVTVDASAASTIKAFVVIRFTEE
jgi:hypothetical protein